MNTKRPGSGRTAGLPTLLCAALISLAAIPLFSCATTPSSVQAREWLSIGNAWSEKGEWARAGSAWARAIELDPNLIGASYNMVRALTESGEYVKAIAAADSLLSSEPSNIRVLALKAYSLARSGRDAEALDVYARVLSQNSLSQDAVYNAAILKVRAGRKTEAMTDLAALFAAVPEDYQATALYGRLCDESGDDSTALTVYESLRKAGKAAPETLIRMGAMYESRGYYSDAMDVYAAGTASVRVPVAKTATDPNAAAPPDSDSSTQVSASQKAEADRQAAMAKALFALARLRLAVAEDGTGGLAALDKALALGFSDRRAADELILLPVLAKREEVITRLRTAGIIP